MDVKRFLARTVGSMVFAVAAAAAPPDPAGSKKALDSAMQTQVVTDKGDAASQKKIGALADKTREMVEDYRLALRQTDNLRVYNDHLERLIHSQNEEMTSIDSQLKELEFTSRGIVPLMVKMVNDLGTFVDLDIPFLPEERHKRVETLKENLDRADVSLAENYRRIMEAYQIEMEYGRTVEAYTGMLQQDGQNRSVNFLRVGRIAFMYQTLDGKESGVWDQAARQWRVLPGEYRASIKNGIRIARKQLAPDLLTLPVPAPERVQ
jgi:hypothetical protein